MRLIISSGALATIIFAIGCAGHQKNEKPPPRYPLKERVEEHAVASTPTPTATPADDVLFRPLDPAGEPEETH